MLRDIDFRSIFIPSVEVWTALIGGFSITFFLIIFAHRPLKILSIVKRYIVSTGCGASVWVFLLKINGGLVLEINPGYCLAILAGALVFLSAVFFNYYLGNISGGFRIEMLVNMSQSRQPVSLAEWMALYGKGRGMHYFLEDRLKATLIPWRLGVWNAGRVCLTPLGHLAGQVNRFFARLLSEKIL
jgi:hypothetical protein